MRSKKLRVTSDFGSGHSKGDIVEVYVDSDNVPINPFWRQRIKDAQSDNCCEFVKEKESKKSKNEAKVNDN